jgi:cellulose synthase/poly-beta-1,6-N-acetylglucosamine synthase-like glycosyltransferase
VGKVQWFGRAIGNHHLGVGGPREVDVLKGVNCAYRRTAIQNVGFDERLLGIGTHHHWELSLGLQLRRAGWKLIYDPAIGVAHYPAQRFDNQREPVDNESIKEEVHNQTLALLEYLPQRQRWVFGFYAVFVGTRDAYGLVQWLRFLPREGRLARRKLRAALSGRAEGWKSWRRDNG